MFEGNHSALFRWKTLKKSVADAVKVLNKIRNLSQDQKVLRAKLRKCIPDIVFAYIYPRLDADVSKHQNHLLKSPFCVHPKTGRVCVPMEVAKIDSFDPFSVPTLPQLMRELDNYQREHGADDSATEHDWQKTSLKGPFEHFRKQFLTPMSNELRRERREEAEQKAAMTGDF